MKSYTFKIKSNKDVVVPVTHFSVHCPYEVLYDSVKQTKELEDSSFFITVEEESHIAGLFKDVFVGDCIALFKSMDLKEWLLMPNYFDWLGLKEDVKEEVKEDGKDE